MILHFPFLLSQTHITHSILNLSPLCFSFFAWPPHTHTHTTSLPPSPMKTSRPPALHQISVRTWGIATLRRPACVFYYWKSCCRAAITASSAELLLLFLTSVGVTNNRTCVHLVAASQMLWKHSLIICRSLAQIFSHLHQSATGPSSIPVCWTAWPGKSQTDTHDNKDHHPLMWSASSRNTPQ